MDTRRCGAGRASRGPPRSSELPPIGVASLPVPTDREPPAGRRSRRRPSDVEPTGRPAARPRPGVRRDRPSTPGSRPAVSAKLRSYVYLLVDPRTGRPFYVGRGRNDRCFRHVEAARPGPVRRTSRPKFPMLDRIREVEAGDAPVRIDILRHGLSPDEALLVERPPSTTPSAFPATRSSGASAGARSRSGSLLAKRAKIKRSPPGGPAAGRARPVPTPPTSRSATGGGSGDGGPTPSPPARPGGRPSWPATWSPPSTGSTAGSPARPGQDGWPGRRTADRFSFVGSPDPELERPLRRAERGRLLVPPGRGARSPTCGAGPTGSTRRADRARVADPSPVRRPSIRATGAGPIASASMDHPMTQRLEELAERREQARNAGSPRAVEKHHAKGKMTARERIDYLLDDGSFQELDMLARHRAHGMGLEENRPYTDGVITGFGTIEGRRVCVFSQDFTVFGGALGEVFAEKIHKVMDLASSIGVPMIGLNDGAGARIQEGVVSLHSYGGHLPPQRPGLGGDPPDQRHPRPVRRRGGVQPGHDRLHLHGPGDQPHVHHRPRRGQDGDRRGRHPRGAGRGHEPRHQVGGGRLRGPRREVVPRRRALPA